MIGQKLEVAVWVVPLTMIFIYGSGFCCAQGDLKAPSADPSSQRLSSSLPLPNSYKSELERQVQVLVRLDLNKDGILEPTEIPQPCEKFVESVVQRIESNQSKDPILEEQVQISTAAKRGVSFDLRVISAAAKTYREPPTTLRSKAITSKAKLAQYSRTLIQIYDKDRDGSLSAAECSHLGKSWRCWDYNKNGRLEPGEIAIRLGNLERNQNASTPTSRADAPESFEAMDTNSDGQIQMVEFTAEWSNEKATEFDQRDANRDGIITLSEWHQHQLEIDHQQ